MNDFASTLSSKSDQLNAADITRPIVVTIRGVSVDRKQPQPVTIALDGDRLPFRPCLGMRRLLSALWGDDASQWDGRQIRLFCDPSTVWGGEEVGGIRISGLSNIEKAVSMRIKVGRGKFKTYIVEPIIVDDTVPRLRKEMMDMFAALGWARDAQLEWLNANYTDVPAAVRNERTLREIVELLEEK
jgi:hypothetical protein